MHSKNTPRSRSGSVLCFGTALTDLALLAIIVGQRTDAALQTPWFGLPLGFFLLFGLSSTLLLAGARHASSRAFWIAALLHSFLTYGVALLVFRQGYGYDPIIHQAAEESIVKQFTGSFSPILHTSDFILLPSHFLLYFEQYAVVTALHFLTTIPVRLIDRALLPVFSVISVPVVCFYGLRHAYHIDAPAARVLTVLVPLLALPALTFTTPYNLTVLPALWWIFLLPTISVLSPLQRHPESDRGISPKTLIIVLIALAAAVTHPLLGIPLLLASLVAVICRILFERSRELPFSSVLLDSVSLRSKNMIRGSIFITSTATTLITTSLTTMFGLYRITRHVSFFPAQSFWSPITTLTVTLFTRVSWTTAPWHLVFFYGIAWAIPVVISIIGLWQLFRSATPPWYRITVLSLAAGLFFAVPFVYSAADIPGILESDQAEFARRLLLAIPIFFLPSFLVALTHRNPESTTCHPEPLFCHPEPRRGISCTNLSILLLATLLTISWYTAYPQVNAAVYRTGWNVAAADLAAVQAIERDAAGQPYVVLSDRLLAAVGLREFGMERRFTTPAGESFYPYAVAPNEVLFIYAQKFLRSELSVADLKQLQTRTGINRIYLVVHEYSQTLKQTIDAVERLGARPINSVLSGVRILILP